MAPGPYCELAHRFFAPLITLEMVLGGSPAGSPSVITMTCGLGHATRQRFGRRAGIWLLHEQSAAQTRKHSGAAHPTLLQCDVRQ